MRALLGFVVLVGACTFAEPADVDALDGTRLSIAAGNEQVGTVGTTLSSPIVINAQDLDGNPIANLTLELAVTAGGAQLESPAITTDVQGNAHTLLKLGTVPGANTLEARILGDGTDPAIATATAIVGSPASIVIASGDAQIGTAGTAVANPLVVKVTDEFSNPVPDTLVEFAITDGNGSTTETTSATDSSGLADIGLVLDTVVGINSVTALVLELTPVTFSATGIAGPAAQLLKTSGDGQSAAAGSMLTDPLGVKVEDIHGNPVPDVDVAFTAVTAGGSVTTASAITAADGTASTTYRLSTTTGTNHVTAEVTGLPALDFVASAVTGSATSITKVSGDNQIGTVNTTLASQLTVVVRDVSNNPVQGFLVTFAVTNGNGVPATPIVATDANGQAKTSFKLGTVAGGNTVQPRGGSLTASVFTATGNAGAPTKVVVFQGAPALVDPYGSPVPLVARVTDAFNNPISGRTVTWSVASGNASVSPSSGVTNPNVQTSFTAGNLADAVVEARSTGLTTAVFNVNVRGFRPNTDHGFHRGFTVRTADINRDGKSDVLLAMTTGLAVFINTTPSFAGTVTLTSPVTALAGSSVRSVAVGDVNGDGKIDLVADRQTEVGECAQSCLTLLVNTTVQGSTNPTFSAVELSNQGLTSVAFADLNLDGKLDIVAVGLPESVVVLIGNGNGTFGAATDMGIQARSIQAVGDLNLDGAVDVISDHFGQRRYLRNTTTFGAPTANLVAGSNLVVDVIADFDLDGKLDTYGVTGSVGLLGHNTTPPGAAAPTLEGSFDSSLFLPDAVSGDLDGDDFPELVVPFGNNIAVAHNRMALGFSAGFLALKSMPAGAQQVARVAVGDLNGDGAMDVVAVRLLSQEDYVLTTLISE